MYVWVQPSLFGPDEFSHVFPRPLGGGIIIGGVRLNNEWNDSFDVSLAGRVKQRACQLCPELGKPEDLQVIRHNVGLRRTLLFFLSSSGFNLLQAFD
jgi:D-amino-acid oxidase